MKNILRPYEEEKECDVIMFMLKAYVTLTHLNNLSQLQIEDISLFFGLQSRPFKIVMI